MQGKTIVLGISAQKVPYVCFDCRIAVKRALPFFYQECPDLLLDVRRRPLQGGKCPRCNQIMAFMGRYFKVPPSGNLKQWRKAKLLWENCWSADGYSVGPKSLRDAKNYLSGSAERARKMCTAHTRAEQDKVWCRARRRRVS